MDLCKRIGLLQIYLYLLESLVKLLVRVFLLSVLKADFKLYQKNLLQYVYKQVNKFSKPSVTFVTNFKTLQHIFA